LQRRLERGLAREQEEVAGEGEARSSAASAHADILAGAERGGTGLDGGSEPLRTTVVGAGIPSAVWAPEIFFENADR
jgi:hypothetical protein